MKITMIFRLEQDRLPSPEEHLRFLWKVARLFEPFGFPIEKWYPSASSPKKSRKHPAFDCNGPTPEALNLLQAKDEKDGTTNYRITAVWNGVTKGRSVVFSASLSVDVHNPTCVLRLQYDDVEALSNATHMQRFMFGLLHIWPATSVIEAGPFKYYTKHQVFPKRPGAGWMLYLAKAITAVELPEAAELVPVMEGDQQKGTIVVSVADEVFSVDKPQHVKIANAIEIRLADQDLLPRYGD